MKNNISILIICSVVLLNISAFTQDLGYTIGKIGDNTLNTIPGFNWKISPSHLFIKKTYIQDTIPGSEYLPKRKEKHIPKHPVFGIGGGIENYGIIYKDVNNDKHKHASKAAGLYFLLSIIREAKNSYSYNYINISGGVKYNFHYREKIFENSKRRNKDLLYSEWNSSRINMFTPYARFEYFHSSGFGFYTEVYFGNLMNNSFIDEKGLLPYEDLYFNKITFGVNFTRVILKVAGTSFSQWLGSN